MEENRITLDRKVNFTSFISILPAEARKKSSSSLSIEKPKKAEKHKENIIADDILFDDDDMDNEVMEPLPLPEDPPPKRVKRKAAKPKSTKPKRKAPRQRENSEEKVRKRPVTEIEWHLENIKNILNSSNATPIRSHDSGGYQCSYCKQQFENLTDLKVHTLTSKSHKKKKPDFLKIHYASLSKHIVYLDVTSLRCNVCQLEMISLEVLMEHLKNDHEENMHLVIKNQIMPLRVVDEKLTCSVCGTAVEFEGIQEHMAQHYRNYVCEFCDTSFVIRSKMIDHKKAVHDL